MKPHAVKAPVMREIDDDSDDSDVEESVVPATAEQVHAAAIFKERQARLQVMQRNADLEAEMGKLRQEVANTRIELLRDQATKLGSANSKMFADAGLNDGDQITDKLEGHEGVWMVIPRS